MSLPKSTIGNEEEYQLVGTDRQLQVFRRNEELTAVVDHPATETVEGYD